MRTDKVAGLKEKLKGMIFCDLQELKEQIALLIKEGFKIYTENIKTTAMRLVMVETIFSKLILTINFNTLFGYFEVEDVVKLKEEN